MKTIAERETQMTLEETLDAIRKILVRPSANEGTYHPPGSARRIADGTIKR